MLVSYWSLAASDGYERRFDSRLPPGSVARSFYPVSAAPTSRGTSFCPESKCHFKLVTTRTKPSYGCPFKPPPLTSPFIAAVVMAELVVAVPPLLRADQAEQRYNEAVQAAVEKCAADTAGRTCFICMDGAAAEGLVRGCACRGGAGYAHLSCLARGAQVAVERSADGLGFERWHTCGLCEQRYHGVVSCALGWACWKTYVGRHEADETLGMAMTVLGTGLHYAGQDEDALSVKEAELSMLRRVGASEYNILVVQSNLAITYENLGRLDEALRLTRDVYTGFLKLFGEEHQQTLLAANNYASSLNRLERFGEAKSLLRKTVPVTRRILGESNVGTLRTRSVYAEALYRDDGATFDDLCEAATTLEEVARTARRVFGGAHPITKGIERELQMSRAVLRADKDTAPGGDVSGGGA